MEGVSDLQSLPSLTDEKLIGALEGRHGAQAVYTYAGPRVIVSLNPYDWESSQPLYSESVQTAYVSAPEGDLCGGRNSLPPHLYACAEQARRRRASPGNNQSIIVGGESGAGKTEAVKIIMRYLCGSTAAQPRSHPAHPTQPSLPLRDDGGMTLVRRLIELNPLLEAFGNAKTALNHNSSRFGKLITLHFRDAPTRGGRAGGGGGGGGGGGAATELVGAHAALRRHPLVLPPREGSRRPVRAERGDLPRLLSAGRWPRRRRQGAAAARRNVAGAVGRRRRRRRWWRGRARAHGDRVRDAPRGGGRRTLHGRAGRRDRGPRRRRALARAALWRGCGAAERPRRRRPRWWRRTAGRRPRQGRARLGGAARRRGGPAQDRRRRRRGPRRQAQRAAVRRGGAASCAGDAHDHGAWAEPRVRPFGRAGARVVGRPYEAALRGALWVDCRARQRSDRAGVRRRRRRRPVDRATRPLWLRELRAQLARAARDQLRQRAAADAVQPRRLRRGARGGRGGGHRPRRGRVVVRGQRAVHGAPRGQQRDARQRRRLPRRRVAGAAAAGPAGAPQRGVRARRRHRRQLCPQGLPGPPRERPPLRPIDAHPPHALVARRRRRARLARAGRQQPRQRADDVARQGRRRRQRLGQPLDADAAPLHGPPLCGRGVVRRDRLPREERRRRRAAAPRAPPRGGTPAHGAHPRGGRRRRRPWRRVGRHCRRVVGVVVGGGVGGGRAPSRDAAAWRARPASSKAAGRRTRH